MDKLDRIKDLLKELKDKGHVDGIKQMADLAKKIKNLDEDKLRQLEKAAKSL